MGGVSLTAALFLFRGTKMAKKINSKQLRQLIIQEISGKKSKPTMKIRRLSNKQKRQISESKKRQRITEARITIAEMEVMEEGLGTFLKKIGGMAAKGIKAAVAAKDTAVSAWEEVSAKVEADEQLVKDFEAELKNDLKTLQSDIMRNVKTSKAFKSIVDDLSDEEKEEKTKELFAAAVALVKAELAALA